MDSFSSLGIPFLQILLGLIAAVYWTQAFFIVYHLSRFGIGPRPKLLALVFLVGSVALFGTTLWFYGKIDLSVSLGVLLKRGLPEALPRVRY